MRIVFFTHYFPPESNAPAARCHSLCKRWVRLGHEVTVVTCVPNCPEGKVYDGYRNRLFQREKIDGIDVRRVWTYLAANKGMFRRTLNYLSYMGSAVVASCRAHAMYARRKNPSTDPAFAWQTRDSRRSASA